MSVKRQRKPFAEPPFNMDIREPWMAELVDALTHYHLDNGWTVSVLRNQGGYWEVMEWHGDGLLYGPRYFDTEAEALSYRDQVGSRL